MSATMWVERGNPPERIVFERIPPTVLPEHAHEEKPVKFRWRAMHDGLEIYASLRPCAAAVVHKDMVAMYRPRKRASHMVSYYVWLAVDDARKERT